MIAVIDSEVSERAAALRKKIFTAGYPCSVMTVEELSQNKPIKLIVAYYSVFDKLRRQPFDDVFAVVIGDGFVNSALNAVRVDNEDEAVDVLKSHLLRIFGLTSRNILPFGILGNCGIFWSKKHFEIYGNIIEPTLSEYMILKYLVAVADTGQYISSEKIRRFCYVRDLAIAKNIDGNIAAHISNLNKKLKEVYGKQIIKPKRYCGYSIDLKKI